MTGHEARFQATTPPIAVTMRGSNVLIDDAPIREALGDLRSKLDPEIDRLLTDPRVVAGTHHIHTDVSQSGWSRDGQRITFTATATIVETKRFTDDD